MSCGIAVREKKYRMQAGLPNGAFLPAWNRVLPEMIVIFLPAAGYRNGSNLNNAGTNGNYWSSSLNTSNPNNAYNLNFNSSNQNRNNNNRYNGRSVRPVLSALTGIIIAWRAPFPPTG